MCRLIVTMLTFSLLGGCMRNGPTGAELFRLRALCADEARQFIAAMPKPSADPAHSVLMIKNHYRQSDGRCYVSVFSAVAGRNMLALFNPLQIDESRPIELALWNDDSPSDEIERGKKEMQKIEAIMQDGED